MLAKRHFEQETRHGVARRNGTRPEVGPRFMGAPEDGGRRLTAKGPHPRPLAFLAR
ncbi:hypothetical protein GCM10012319_53820 [Comamonas sp. KCTC 72670]|nr:hypothetical protein GCM10012319_53820 [Comamonas sp. KCTC 72670]